MCLSPILIDHRYCCNHTTFLSRFTNHLINMTVKMPKTNRRRKRNQYTAAVGISLAIKPKERNVLFLIYFVSIFDVAVQLFYLFFFFLYSLLLYNKKSSSWNNDFLNVHIHSILKSLFFATGFFPKIFITWSKLIVFFNKFIYFSIFMCVHV